MPEHPGKKATNGIDGEDLVRLVDQLLSDSEDLGKHAGDPDELALQALALKLYDARQAGEELLRQVQSGAVVKFRKVLNGKIHTRGLPRMGPDGKRHGDLMRQDAARLVQRHNSRVITARLLQYAENIRNGVDVDDNKKKLDSRRKEWRKNGFFLIEYGVGLPDDQKKRDMYDRLHRHYQFKDDGAYSPRFICRETGGGHPDKNIQPRNLHEPGVWCADCQIHLPPPVRNAWFVMEMPNKNDDPPPNPEWVRNVQPHEVALVEDIVCLEEMAGLAIAPAALSDAIAELIEANATRRDFPIRYLAADIASVEGYKTPEGIAVDFQRDLGIPPLFNDRSAEVFNQFEDNEHLETGFQTYCTLNRRLHRVVGDFQLIVTWHRKVAKLKIAGDR